VYWHSLGSAVGTLLGVIKLRTLLGVVKLITLLGVVKLKTLLGVVKLNCGGIGGWSCAADDVLVVPAGSGVKGALVVDGRMGGGPTGPAPEVLVLDGTARDFAKAVERSGVDCCW
jgi:hypothetical protein